MIGTSIGHYRIDAKLGAGGMGEVYVARDLELGRDVAIKVLPEELAGDALPRFEREARLLASLNHPHIATVYGLVRSGERPCLVMELLEGESLAERLDRGPLPVPEALELARQIATGLAAAHEAGIVHRDLKPANVRVTVEGTVKVLDFGLAKALEPESAAGSAPDISASPTRLDATGAGMILGTAGYMSPEQARGQPVDQRTDIWAYGCVLYEMLTGQRAFGGDTVSDTLVAILEREADWAALPAGLPRAVHRLLTRCLRKDAARRLHHIADARLEIEEALAGGPDDRDPAESAAAYPSGNEAPGLRARLGAAAWPIAAVALIAAAAGYGARALLDTDPGGAVAPTRLQEVMRVTHDPGLSEWPTWSPDGRQLAFASNRGGDFDVYVRRVEGGQEVNVTDDPGDDYQPAFSPDGEWIAFVSTRSSSQRLVKIGATFGMEFRTYGGDVWLAPALGGQARRLGESGNAPAWHPDAGSVIYVSGREDHRSILRVGLQGERETLLSEADSTWEIVRAHYSPDARWISFDTVPDRAMIMPAGGGPPRELLAGVSHVWDPSGERLYYMSRDAAGGTRLLAVAFDPARGEVRGTPQTVGLVTGTLRDLTLDPSGESFAAVRLDGSLNLTLLPLNAAGDAPSGPERALSPGQVIDRYPAFSPDGSTIAFASDRLGREEVWLLDLESNRYERLELPREDQGVNLPYWSPDGREVFVTRYFADGDRSIWRAAVDGSGAEELVAPGPAVQGSPPSPDGRLMLYSARGEDYVQLYTLDLATGETTRLTASPGDKSGGVWSPDGDTVVFHSNASGAVQLWELDLSTGAERRLTDTEERIRHAFYSPDGRWIYFQPNHLNVYRMPASGGAAVPVTRFPESGLFLEEPALSPDGRFLAYCRSNGGSSVWVLGTGNRQAADETREE